MMLFSEKAPLDHGKLIDFTLKSSDKYRFLSVSSFGQDSAGRIMPAFSIGAGEKTILYVGLSETAAFMLMRFVDEFCNSCLCHRKIFSCDPSHIYGTRRLSIIPTPSLFFCEDKEKILQNMRTYVSKLDTVSSVTLYTGENGRIGYYALPEFSVSASRRARKLSLLSGYEMKTKKTPEISLEQEFSAPFRSACSVGCRCEQGQEWIDKYLSLRRLLFENMLYE